MLHGCSDYCCQNSQTNFCHFHATSSRFGPQALEFDTWKIQQARLNFNKGKIIRSPDSVKSDVKRNEVGSLEHLHLPADIWQLATCCFHACYEYSAQRSSVKLWWTEMRSGSARQAHRCAAYSNENQACVGKQTPRLMFRARLGKKLCKGRS